jgi:hypothetical protein
LSVRLKSSARLWSAAALCRFRVARPAVEKRRRAAALQDAGAQGVPGQMLAAAAGFLKLP